MKNINWDIPAPQKKESSWQRIKWYELGGGLSIPALLYGAYLFLFEGHPVQGILWINFFALLIHQFEEYGYPGWFPSMINRGLFGSDFPLSYPLNRLSAWWVNAPYSWGLNFLAIYFAQYYPFAAVAIIVFSLGNLLGHLVFLVKTRRWYHPGLLTALLLFLPIIYIFFVQLMPIKFLDQQLLMNGVLVGIIATAIIPILILLMARENPNLEFGGRHEMPSFRKFEL